MRTHRTQTHTERETISYQNAQAQHPLSSHWIISNLLTVLRDKFARFSDICMLSFECLFVYLLLVVFALFLGSGNVSHILKSAALMNDRVGCFFLLLLSCCLRLLLPCFFALSFSLAFAASIVRCVNELDYINLWIAFLLNFYICIKICVSE